ncbi:hypothetical protein [Massilia sp. BKSP1R2A-1]|uniref:hypothetical protein n=1 Tax=Massilia sp. BKSP1R2A-1 TaxID=3422595 RepID=UPI003D33E48E
MNVPDAAIGAIIASIIGAAMILISTILSKEQKTSEFRQSWVDSLRDDLSELIGGVSELVVFAHEKSKAGAIHAHEFLEENFETLERLERLHVRVLLRLNPKEHTKLAKLIDDLVGNTVEEIKSTAANEEVLAKSKKLIIEESQRVLKLEWKRVKSGELAFRTIKYLSAVGVSVGVIVLAIYGLNVADSSGWFK